MLDSIITSVVTFDVSIGQIAGRSCSLGFHSITFERMSFMKISFVRSSYYCKKPVGIIILLPRCS